MQVMIPTYLEHSMNTFAREQEKLREQMSKAFGGMGQFGIGNVEDQVRRNMDMFQKAMGMFMPFGTTPASQPQNPASRQDASSTPPGRSEEADDDIKALKKQIAEMQKKLDKL